MCIYGTYMCKYMYLYICILYRENTCVLYNVLNIINFLPLSLTRTYFLDLSLFIQVGKCLERLKSDHQLMQRMTKWQCVLLLFLSGAGGGRCLSSSELCGISSRKKLSGLECALIFQDEKFSQIASRDDLLIKSGTARVSCIAERGHQFLFRFDILETWRGQPLQKDHCSCWWREAVSLRWGWWAAAPALKLTGSENLPLFFLPFFSILPPSLPPDAGA